MSDATERLNAALEGRYTLERDLPTMLDAVARLNAALEGHFSRRLRMNRRVRLLIVSLFLPSLSCGPTEPNCGTFEDARLEAAQGALTCGDVTRINTLIAENSRIVSLAGIEDLTGLMDLRLANNSITDISPLSGLTSLTLLVLSNNSITDISALSGLTNLESLFIQNNSITDISPLSGLTNLELLFIQNNSITDISPLSGLTSLRKVFLENNPDLSNIQSLLDNSGLGAGDRVGLAGTNVGCADVAALEAKGVGVDSDCP